MFINWLIAIVLTIACVVSEVYIQRTRKKHHFTQVIAALVFLAIIGWTVFRLCVR